MFDFEEQLLHSLEKFWILNNLEKINIWCIKQQILAKKLIMITLDELLFLVCIIMIIWLFAVTDGYMLIRQNYSSKLNGVYHLIIFFYFTLITHFLFSHYFRDIRLRIWYILLGVQKNYCNEITIYSYTLLWRDKRQYCWPAM